MNSSNYSILVHTFNRYSFAWPGFFKAWRENMNDYPVYWGSDMPGKGIPDGFIPIFSGPGEWSDRLRALLAQIPTDYVLYMQEDHWPTKSPPNLSEMMEMVSECDLFRLQISPVNQFYSLYGSGIPLFFHEKSKYLVSHQPSIWKKSFLLECLEPGESPWKNEYEGTKRLNNRPEIRGKIAIYPYQWYAHRCIKGKIVD